MAQRPNVEDQAAGSGNAGNLDKHKSDIVDRIRVRNLVRTAVTEKPGLRGLVHLIDAQSAVQGNLARLNDSNIDNREVHRGARGASEDGLDMEEDPEQEHRSKGVVFQSVSRGMQPDKF